MKPIFAVARRLACVCAALSAGGVAVGHDALAQTAPATTHAATQAGHVNTVRDLSLSAAQKLVANALRHAAERDMRLAVSVVDRAGNLPAFARMDGASIVTVDVAVGEARTAAFIKAPSKAFEDMIDPGRQSMATTPSLLPLQGGMPILLDGEVIGAVARAGLDPLRA